MYLYGYKWKRNVELHSFWDIGCETSPFIIYSFGHETELTISTNEETSFHDLDIKCYLDKFIIRSELDEPRYLAITNNNWTSMNMFETATGNSVYAKPCMNELSKIWFVAISKPNDASVEDVSFHLPTKTSEMTNKTFYPYPVVYDQVSKKDYLISTKSFVNVSDKFVVVRSFAYVPKDIEVDYDSSVVLFVDGVQSNKIPKGLRKLDFYVDPNTELQFPDVIFVPEDSIVSYPLSRTVETVPKGDVVYRMKLPCHFDFCKVLVNGVEVPSLRLGNIVYFKGNGIVKNVELYQERPSSVLDATEIYTADSIIDIEYTIDTGYVCISGHDIKLDDKNYINYYDKIREEIEIVIDLSNSYTSPLPGEYFTVNSYFNGVRLDNVMFTITEVDTTDINKTKVRGVRL